MSETDLATSGGESQASGSEGKNENNYPKHFVDKLLGEKKKVAAEAEELRKKLAEIETEKLQAQGKDKELIEALKKQVAESQTSLKKTQSQYAQNVIFASIKAEAVKQGCIDTDLLMEVAKKRLDTLTVDETTFEVSQEDLTRMVSTIATEKSILFKKAIPGVKDATPGAAEAKPVKMDAANLSKMKEKDLQKLLAMKLGK